MADEDEGAGWLLSPEEFDTLSPDEQQTYLELASAQVDAWVLTDKQQHALGEAEEVDQLFYGGAAGGGKTDLILYHADDLSRRVPLHKSLILRTSFPELRRTLIQRSHEKLRAGPDLQWRAADKLWKYRNGSIIEFGYCTSLADAAQYLSAEYDLICIDESSEMPPDVIELLNTRLRTTKRKKAAGCRPHLVLCSNPGGIAHHWHKANFVDATEHGAHRTAVTVKVGTEERWMTRAFVQSLPGDNPHLDENYVINLAALSDPVKRAQYLQGDWTVFEGIFFESWSHPDHVRDFDVAKLPAEWERDRGIDYGFSAPYCALEAAFDHDGRAWVYRECYGTKRTPKMQAAEILRGGKVKLTLADPACWAQTGIGESVVGQWRAAGLHAVKGNNNRDSGWATVRDYLAVWPDGKPGIVVHPSCVNLIRTLPMMQRDPNRLEDLNTRLEDHAVDALRYLLANRPAKPKPPPTPASDRDAASERAYQHLLRKAKEAKASRRSRRAAV